MSKSNSRPYFYPIGMISLIILPLILLFYSWDHPLLRQRCLEMFGEGLALDRDLVYVDKYNFKITNEDFPYSANLNGLINICAKQDSTHKMQGRIILHFSRDLLYQNYISLVDQLHNLNHYVVFIESWRDSHEFYVYYRYKEWLDSIPPYHINIVDYDYEYANLYGKFKLLVQRNTPYKYFYLSQIFYTRPLLWLIPVSWLLLLFINIIRIIQFHKMRRLTRRSS